MYRVTILNNNVRTEIHSPYSNNLKLLSGSIKKGINTFDSFDFSYLPNNPCAGKMRPLQTLVDVQDTLTGKTLFRGQALIPDNSMESDESFTYSYTCASTLSFLQYSIQDYAKIQNTTPEGFFRYLIDIHNSKMSENHKKFTVGIVTVTNSTDNIYRYVDETQTTWQTIKEKLIDRVGGEVQVRYEDGINYIDYITEIGHVSETIIKVKKNMISFSKQIDPTQVFTVFKPRGARPENTGEPSGDYSAAEPRLTIESVNGGKDYLLASPEMIEEFGYKEVSESYDGITTPALLKTRGLQFLATQKAALVKYTLTAVDLSILGIDPESYEIGNYYKTENEFMAVNEILRVVGVTIDIINPQVSSMTIGDKEKSLSEYQKEANALNENYKKIQQSITSLISANRELLVSLENAQTDLDVVKQSLVNIDVENLPVELQGISQQLTRLQSSIDNIQQEVSVIPTYELVTPIKNGLMSYQDKTKLDLIVATKLINLDNLDKRVKALETPEPTEPTP